MAVRSLKLLGGAVRGSEGHLASEKGHLLAKRALFSTITGGAVAPLPPPPAAQVDRSQPAQVVVAGSSGPAEADGGGPTAADGGGPAAADGGGPAPK